MKATVLFLLIAMVASPLVAGEAASTASASSPSSLIEVRFVDGSTMEVAGYEIHQNYVWFILPSGVRQAFDKTEIDLPSLPVEGATGKTTAASGSTKPARPADLRSYAASNEIQGKPEIKIERTWEERAARADQHEKAYDAWLNSLSEEQRNFDEFADELVMESIRENMMLAAINGDLPPRWSSVANKHRILSKADDNELLILEDGSLWEIDPHDRLDTVFWIPMDDVVVLESDDCYLPFSYLLVNTDDSEGACARYVGR